MVISRRKFLQSVGLAATAQLPLSGWARNSAHLDSPTPLDCAVVDLGVGCGLRESLVGYQSALAELGVPFKMVSSGPPPPARVLLVPAAVRVTTPMALALREHLQTGSSLLLESAAGFAEPAELRAHRATLREYFELEIAGQRNLWDAGSQRGVIPYIDYVWPHAAKVRDHSRVVTLEHRQEEIIGRVQGSPVALQRTIGKGTLVFLGSPLGPALWAGDHEAREWLRASLQAVLARRVKPARFVPSG